MRDRILQIVLFVFPFVAFWLYAISANRRRTANGIEERVEMPWVVLGVLSLLLGGAGLIFLRFDKGEAPEGRYVPAHVENGELVPAHYEYPPTPAEPEQKDGE